MKYTIYKSQAGFIISLLSEVDIEHHQKLQAIAKGKSVLSTKEDSTLFSYEVCTLSALSQARYVLQEAGFAQVWTWPTRVQSGGGEPRLYHVDEPHPWDPEQGPPGRESTIHQEGGLVMEAQGVKVQVGFTFTEEELRLLRKEAGPWSDEESVIVSSILNLIREKVSKVNPQAKKTYMVTKSRVLGGFILALQSEVGESLHQRLSSHAWTKTFQKDLNLWSYEILSLGGLMAAKDALHEVGFTLVFSKVKPQEEAPKFKLQDVLEAIAKEQEGCQVFAFPVQGKSCLASHLVHGSLGSFFASIVRYTDDENREEISKAFEDMHTDVLVSGSIVYFPGIPFEGPK